MTTSLVALGTGAAASLLERLPTELIENILLEVVDEHRPIDKLENYGDYPYRQNGANSFRLAAGTTLLAHRLVSRTLRDNSWRSFARVLIDTVFDLNSRDSVESLVQMSKCKALAPWVHQITIACFTLGHMSVYNDYGSNAELFRNVDKDTARALQAELDQAQEDDGWFPAVRKWTDGRLVLGEHNSELSEDTRDMVRILSQCLSEFPNLIGLHYHYKNNWIIPRVRSIASRLPRKSIWQLTTGPSLEAYYGALVGLRILLKAAAIAGVKPKHLDLAVQLWEPYSFNVLVSPDEIAGLFASVEVLSLRDRLDHEDPGVPSISTVLLTNSTFPRLTHLILDTDAEVRFSGSSTLPQAFVTDIPRLLKITMIGWSQSDTKLLAFLSLFKGIIRAMDFRKMQDWDYKPLLMALQSLGLDELAIWDVYYIGLRPVYKDAKDELDGKLEEVLKSVARRAYLNFPLYSGFGCRQETIIIKRGENMSD